MKDYFVTLIQISALLLIYAVHIWLVVVLTGNGYYPLAVFAFAAFIATALHTIDIAEWVEEKLP